MQFKEWIKQSYGVENDDHTARFTVYNMEVAYESREREVDELITALKAAFKVIGNLSPTKDSVLAGYAIHEALEKHGGK